MLFEPNDGKRQKKEEYLKKAFDSHFRRLVSIALEIIGHTGIAEDIVLEKFMDLWTAGFDFNHPKGQNYVKNYLTVCVKNACRGEIKSAKKREALNQNWSDANLYHEDQRTLEGKIMTGEIVDKATSLVRMLPPDLAIVWQKLYVEKLKSAEAALILGIPVEDVYQRHRRLKELVEKEMGSNFMWIFFYFSPLLSSIL